MPRRRIAYLLSILYLVTACASSGNASISSFSPTTGPVGITVTVFGTSLDGGGTSAMWLGSYRVGPGRLLPNTVLLTGP